MLLKAHVQSKELDAAGELAGIMGSAVSWEMHAAGELARTPKS